MIPLWYLVLGVGVSVLAVTGNGIVAYLIVTRPQLHNAANWIVLSLALADFLVGAGSVLTQCLQRASIITHNVNYSIISFLYSLSTTNLCLLALERYIFITKPLRYADLVRTRRVVLVIASAWVAVLIPHLLLYLICIKLPVSDESSCVEDFVIFDFVFFETLPTIILAFALGKIFYISRKLSRETAAQAAQLRFNHGPENARKASTKNERNSAKKIVGTAVTVFTICYLAELYYTVFYQFNLKISPVDFDCANNFIYILNSAVNPVAYAIFKSDIKRNLGKLCCFSRGNAIEEISLPTVNARPARHAPTSSWFTRIHVAIYCRCWFNKRCRSADNTNTHTKSSLNMSCGR